MKIKQLGYLSAALLLTLSACGNEGNNNDENGDDEEIVVIPVEATTVSRGDISAYYSNTATLEAEQEALVVAKVRGIINQVLVSIISIYLYVIFCKIYRINGKTAFPHI